MTLEEEVARMIDPYVFDPVLADDYEDVEAARKHVLAIARAILARVVPAGWRTIESAPRDETPVDLWMEAGYRVRDAHWGETEVDEDEVAGFAWLDEHGDWIEGEDNRATHWMPLPPPPAARGEGT